MLRRQRAWQKSKKAVRERARERVVQTTLNDMYAFQSAIHILFIVIVLWCSQWNEIVVRVVVYTRNFTLFKSHLVVSYRDSMVSHVVFSLWFLSSSFCSLCVWFFVVVIVRIEIEMCAMASECTKEFSAWTKEDTKHTRKLHPDWNGTEYKHLILCKCEVCTLHKFEKSLVADRSTYKICKFDVIKSSMGNLHG